MAGENIAEVIEGLGAKFEEFKAANDKAIASSKSEVVKLTERADKVNDELGTLNELKERLDKLENKSSRIKGSSDVASKDYAKDFYDGFIRKGDESGLLEKSVNLGNDSDGGFGVPEELDREIDKLLKNQSVMRQECRVISVGNEEYKKLVNTGGANAGWVGETDDRPKTDTPKLTQLTPIFGELYANPMATQKSLDDMFFDVEKWLLDEVGDEFARMESEAALTGNGTNKMKGILGHTLSVKDDRTRAFGEIQKIKSGAASEFNADNLISLVYALKKGYRTGSKFMLNSNTLAYARKFKDSQGNYLWQPSLQAGQPSLMLGYQIAENEDVPDIGASSTPVLFGDFKRSYTIIDRVGTRMLRDPFSYKPYVGFYTTKRVGGMLNNSSALKVLALGA